MSPVFSAMCLVNLHHEKSFCISCFFLHCNCDVFMLLSLGRLSHCDPSNVCVFRIDYSEVSEKNLCISFRGFV